MGSHELAAACKGQPVERLHEDEGDSEPLPLASVLPALQQLYSAYKVEYYAGLEELRAKRQQFVQAGRAAPPQPGAASAGDAAAAAPPAPAAAVDPTASVRQMVLALHAATGAPESTQKQLQRAVDRRQQQQQQQHAATNGGDDVVMVDADAAATEEEEEAKPLQHYGDERCGYGSDDEPVAYSDAEDDVIAATAAGAAAATAGAAAGAAGEAPAASGAAAPGTAAPAAAAAAAPPAQAGEPAPAGAGAGAEASQEAAPAATVAATAAAEAAPAAAEAEPAATEAAAPAAAEAGGGGGCSGVAGAGAAAAAAAAAPAAAAAAAGGGDGGGAVGPQQLSEWNARFKGASGSLAELEQMASAVTLQYLDAQGALACFCGRHTRYLVRRVAVSLGRSTDSRGDVDVDLARESEAAAAAAAARLQGEQHANGGSSVVAAAAGDAAAAAAASPAAAAVAAVRRVSRLQAQVSLGLDGTFTIKNVGRRSIRVDGQEAPRGKALPLRHLSLVQVGGVRLLFLVNGLAVKRAVLRSQFMSM